MQYMKSGRETPLLDQCFGFETQSASLSIADIIGTCRKCHGNNSRQKTMSTTCDSTVCSSVFNLKNSKSKPNHTAFISGWCLHSCHRGESVNVRAQQLSIWYNLNILTIISGPSFLVFHVLLVKPLFTRSKFWWWKSCDTVLHSCLIWKLYSSTVSKYFANSFDVVVIPVGLV